VTTTEPIEMPKSGEITLSIAIGGMTCGACAARIERRLNDIEGVSASVNYATERARIALAADVPPERLVDEIRSAGYDAELVQEMVRAGDHAADADRRARSLGRRLLVAAILFMPLCDLSIGWSLDPYLRFPGWQWLLIALAAPVVTWAAWPFYKTALRNARHGTSTMDTLVSLGIVAATTWSLYGMFWGRADRVRRSILFVLSHQVGGAVYLDVAAGVTTFLLAGRYFEALSKRRAGNALRSLAAVGAKDVCVLDADGAERRLPVTELGVGDRFLVRPGETVATDGEVVLGQSAIDLSAMTGESLPIDVAPGDQVVGGTVSVGGRLIVRATKVGLDTQLAQMVRLVEDAQNEKAAVQRLADRISGVFVPAVLVIALVTLQALEASRQVDTVVIDKTGTVTEGQMVVTDVEGAPGVDRALVLRWAGALEQASEHLIARAVTAAARADLGVLPPVLRFVARPGVGARGSVDGHDISVGKADLFAAGRAAMPAALRAHCAEWESLGRTAVLVGRDEVIVGAVAVSDTLRASAAEAVRDLQALGLHCMLVTGDNEPTARAVGAAIGVTDVVAGVLPADKVALIHRLQREGRSVAMVGDGVNDGPALASADLGLAVGSGTDVAINAADLIIVRDDLRVVAHAIGLARRTLRTIRGNLAWAFAYNVAAIPVAAFGLLNPLIAGAAMALSSGFVVWNSARLRHYAPAGFSPRRTSADIQPDRSLGDSPSDQLMFVAD
jgi:cation-transporting P-type ATPase A/B/Cu+-exporting ATPase